jgi:hypothetical protein
MKVTPVRDESVGFMAVKELSRFISSDRKPTDPKLLLLHPPPSSASFIQPVSTHLGPTPVDEYEQGDEEERRNDAQDDDENPQELTITQATSRQV